MADVPQRLDLGLGLGKADPEAYFRRLALYSYAVAPLFPGRKQEGQYVPGLRQYAAGGRILEDEFPSAYMPGVGRQVMAGGGRSIEKALELARSIITSAPEKSVNAYKLFRKKDDQLYPLFVNANTPVPMGEWLAAQSGPMVGEKVKSSLGPLAYRPGWHAGDLPIATHIGGKSAPGLNAPDYRPDNQVWAEIAMPDDVDWQTEALRRAQLNKRGEIIPRTAHITDQVPVGGYYRYKTNPNMTGDWMIGGSMRVNRILPDEEVMEINRARGVSDLPRLEDILKRQGMQEGGAPSGFGGFKGAQTSAVPQPYVSGISAQGYPIAPANISQYGNITQPYVRSFTPEGYASPFADPRQSSAGYRPTQGFGKFGGFLSSLFGGFGQGSGQNPFFDALSRLRPQARDGYQDGGAPQPGDEASQFVRGQLSLPTAAEQARIDEILRPSPLMEQYGGYGTTQAIRQNVARPMPTSSQFVQHQLRGNEPQLPQMDREAYNTMKELAVAPLSMAAYNVPVAGQILGAIDLAKGIHGAGRAIQSGDKGDIAASLADTAMAATGVKGKPAKILAGAISALMPEEAQATFFSSAAKMSPAMRQAFETAKRAASRGMSPEGSFALHSIAPDPSGKMIGEISDLSARLIPSGLGRFRSGEQISLGDLLSHPELYDLYPGSFSASVVPFDRPPTHRGYFNVAKDEIGSNVRLSDRDLLENLLHEHQHRVQHIEQMSPGTSPDVFPSPDRLTDPLKEDLQSANGAMVLKAFMERNPTLKPIDAIIEARKAGLQLGPQPLKFAGLGQEELRNTQELLSSQINRIYETTPDPYQQYFRSLGEVTARLPGERLEMTAPERRMAYPFTDEKIIVRPPSTAVLANKPNAAWEKAREDAIALSRELQQQPLPSKVGEFVDPLEEALMQYAQKLEARKRAEKFSQFGSTLPTIRKDKGGSVIKAALKTIGKLMPEGSGYAGVPGKPSLVNLPGIGKVEARPIPEIESAAGKYMQSVGRPGEHEIASFPEFNPAFATKVAEAFAEMKHRPGDPAVRRAYDALIDETMAQYRAAKDTGIDFRFLKEGQQDPYAASPALGYEDIVNRGRLFVFPTEQGFGSSGGLIADNPLLRRAGKVGDKPDAVINDAFRIVHDLYGHFGPGNPFFRAPGEERAYQLHSRMFGPEALPAATLETRGQNSWLNYGPYGEANRSALGADTRFAEQKIGRMPEWTQAPAPAVGSDVEEYIRSLTGKAEGGEVERDGGDPDMVSRALDFLSQFNPVGAAQAETLPGVVAKALARKIVPTVKNLARDEPIFPGVYGNPREMAKEAESRVAPEDPIMKQIFGVTRQDVFDIAARRPGNVPPAIKAPPERTRGVNYASEGVMTPENERRLIDILAEGEKQPGLRTGMMPWYYMDPVYNRMEQMFGPEEAAKRYNIFNTTIGAMSPGSPVQTEINRGLGAYHLATQGRLEDFLTYGGKPSAAPEGTLPSYVREAMLGHPYHSTSQAGPLKRFFETGEYTTGTPKVPLYIQASGVPETGFQTTLPVPDAHYTRILGMPDVRKTADPEVSMKMGEYRPIGPWFRESVAKPAEMEAVPAQALLWGTGSGATGVDTPIGSPKLEMLAQEIANIARRRGVTPETARDLVLQGKLYAEGGSVIDDAIRVSSDIANARELEAA